MRKRKLREQVETLDTRLGHCEMRVTRLQNGIQAFLDAYNAGEMGNRDKAIEHLEALVGVMPK